MLKDKLRSFFKSDQKEEPKSEDNNVSLNNENDDLKINLSIDITDEVSKEALEEILEDNVYNIKEVEEVIEDIPETSNEREIAMASFKPFADNLNCDSTKELESIYLHVREHILQNIGVSNPDNPYDYLSIIQNIRVFINKVDVDFVRLHTTKTSKETTIPSPCNNAPVGETVTAFVDVEECKVVAAGRYAPVLYHPTGGLLDGMVEFVGLDQIVDYYLPDEKIYEESDFTIQVVPRNGQPDPTLPNYGGNGFIGVTFIPDNPDDPNGHGEYFFKIVCDAKILIK